MSQTRADPTRIWELNLQLSTETLAEAAPGIDALGLEPKEFFVLDAVESYPYPADIATRLSMPRPTITLYLKNLETKGFLTRAIDAQDLRRHRLALTTLGRKILVRSRALIINTYRQRLVRLSKQEQSELARLLQKLTG